MAKKRLLTDDEKRINRLRKRFEKNPYSEAAWKEWLEARSAFYLTPAGAEAYREVAFAAMGDARNVPLCEGAVYPDGYYYAEALLWNARLLDQRLAVLRRIT